MSTLKGKLLEQYIKEFPFLAKILDLRRVRTSPSFHRIYAKVGIADRDLLYLMPQHSGKSDFVTSTEHPALMGKLSTEIYLFNENSVLYDMGAGKGFLKDIVDLTGEDVGYVVVFEKILWYTKGLNPTLAGKLKLQEDNIKIYKKPEGGFVKLLQSADLSRNVRITRMLDISMHGYHENPEAARAMERLEEIKQMFLQSVGTSLWNLNRKSKTRGIKGLFGKTEVLSYELAGRIMITLRSGDKDITFVGDTANHSRTGLQSMCCTVDEAHEMVSDVCANWQEEDFMSDENVRIRGT